MERQRPQPVPLVLAYDDGSQLHDVPGHPESAQRLRAVTRRLVADPALRRLPTTVVGDADPELMLGVHDETHLLAVEHAARSGGCWIDEDTYCTSPPELIVVSAGYDAHRADPMAQLELETATYAEVARRIAVIAAECAGGRARPYGETGEDDPTRTPRSRVVQGGSEMTQGRVTLAGELSREECLELLQYNSYVGRLGFIAGGRPMVLPVNYLAEETFLVFCTAPGTLLSSAVGTPVAFEVDGVRSLYRSGWSVVVQGVAEAVSDPVEVERLRRGPLKSWAAPGPQQWVRVAIDEISGRRISAG